MAQVWKPGVLKANMPEHGLVRFTVANVMPGWDPKWLEELLAKTEETLRTLAHPLVKAFGPFSPTKLDSSRLSMLMQGIASALVAANKKEKEEGTSAQKATAKEAAAPSPKEEEEDEEEEEEEEEELDEEDEEDEEEGDSSDDDSDDDGAAKSPHWFVVRWLHIEQVAIFRELVQRKLLNQAKAKRRLDAMDLEGESIEGLREKMAERQRKLMDVVNDVLDAKVEREGGKRECAVQVLSDVKDMAGRYMFEEIDRRMEDYFNSNINEYALRDSHDYEEEELREKVEGIVKSHGRKATLACLVHARNFRSLLEEWARLFGSEKVFEMLDETMDEVEETVEDEGLGGFRASTMRRLNALMEKSSEKARKLEKERDALAEEMERRGIVPPPESDSGHARSKSPPRPRTAAEVGTAIAARASKAAAAKMEGKERTGHPNAEAHDLLGNLMTVTWSTTLRELVRRGVMNQREAKEIIDRNDSESDGKPGLYLPTLLFQFLEEEKDRKDPSRKKSGTKTMQERSTPEGAEEAVTASFNLYKEMRDLGFAKLWEDVLRIVEQRLLLAISEDGLRPLGYQDCELQSALRAEFFLLHGNDDLDAALAAIDGKKFTKPAEQLMVLLEYLEELFPKEAVYKYVGEALNVIVTEVEERLGARRH